MPYNRQTPEQELQMLQTELDGSLAGADARLRGSPENAVAKIVTLGVHDLHGYIAWMFKQIHPKTADEDYLENNHASLRKITRKPATAAVGSVTFTGTNGTTIPEGTVLRRADGQEYTTDAGVLITAGSATVAIRASAAGFIGNASAGSKLSMTSPIAGVQSAAVIAAGGCFGGADLEGVEDLRRRVLQRWAKPPQGGADHDYESWALEVAGVTRAWILRHAMGVGTVMVIFVMDNKPDTIIPTPEEAELVRAYIDPKRNATAKGLFVIPPSPFNVDFTIRISPDTPAIRAAITAELQDFFRREAEPGGTLYLSRMNEAISAATGEFDHELVTPAANVTRDFAEISMLGEITFEAFP